MLLPTKKTMSCQSCIEVKAQLADFFLMIEPIVTKLTQLKALNLDTIGHVCVPEATAPTVDHNIESMEVNDSENTESSQQAHPNVNNRRAHKRNLSATDISGVTKRQTTGIEKDRVIFDDAHDDIGLTLTVPADVNQSEISPLSQFIYTGVRERNVTNDKPKSIDKKLLRSVYLTPFVIGTESSHILEHLNGVTHIQPLTHDFVITKLAKRKPRKGQQLTFISFKVDVPRQHYDTVLSNGNWPKEINVKEFFPKRPSPAQKPDSRPQNTAPHKFVAREQPEPSKQQHVNPFRFPQNRPQPKRNFNPKQSNSCQKDCCLHKRPLPVVKNCSSACTGGCNVNRPVFRHQRRR